jgi:hypothetical protein
MGPGGSRASSSPQQPEGGIQVGANVQIAEIEPRGRPLTARDSTARSQTQRDDRHAAQRAAIASNQGRGKM